MSEMRVQEPVEVTLQTEDINVVNAVSPRIVSITKVTGATEITVEDILGVHTLSIPDGAQGETGATGATGNGIASAVLNNDYTLTLTFTDGTSYTTPSIRGAQGETGATGATGAAGYTPVKGVDYFDGEKGDKGDKGDTGDTGVGVPTGGTTGQVLTKASGTDYDTEWTTVEAGGGTVTDVQVNGTSVVTDGVANVPMASNGVVGLVKPSTTYGTNVYGANNTLGIVLAELSHIKSGAAAYNAIPSSRAYYAAFYGLAKAAGDTTQSASSNAVGTYTENAKSKISEMLSAPVTVSGTTPTITALSGIQYVCGEVSTLDITLPASGIVDVVFQSGSTPTVLTITPPTGITVKWANGFDPTSLEANTTYELNIKDGLGVAVGWT